MMQQVYKKEFNNEEIGMGFNSRSGLAIGTALDVGEVTENKVAPGQQVAAEVFMVNTQEELMEKMGMSFEAQGRYGAFSASLKASFSESTSFNSTSSFLIARCIVHNSFVRGHDFRVKPYAEKYLTSNRLDEFRLAYGDSFVRGIQTGGEFYCVIRITSLDTKVQSNLSAKAHAEFTGLAAGLEFQAEFNKANSSSMSRSEYTASMYQRGGKGEQSEPVLTIQEALKRYKEFPKFTQQNPVGFETEIANYNTIPLPLPTPEEQENFELALRDAREKKLEYLQKKNDLEFAKSHSEFFEDLPSNDILQEAINTYLKLINAAMVHGMRLSRGEISPPTLFVPPVNEPAPIKLKRVTPATHVVVPKVVGMHPSDAGALLREKGLIPKPIVNMWHPTNEPQRIVLKQNPEAGMEVPKGSEVEIHYNRVPGTRLQQDTLDGISWKPPLKLIYPKQRE
jgi:hypothetical protein